MIARIIAWLSRKPPAPVVKPPPSISAETQRKLFAAGLSVTNGRRW